MTRVKLILADTDFRECIAQNCTREADRKFCGHNLQHMVDVARIAYILMLEGRQIEQFMEECDINQKLAKEVIYAAALLHDIGRWLEYETGADHAAISAGLAPDILKRAGYYEPEISVITTAIMEHRRPQGQKSMLGACLYKADKLSRMCSHCDASGDCYKIDEMETLRETLIY